MKKLILIPILLLSINIFADKPVIMYDVFVVGDFNKTQIHANYYDRTDKLIKAYIAPSLILGWTATQTYLWTNNKSGQDQMLNLMCYGTVFMATLVYNEYRVKRKFNIRW